MIYADFNVSVKKALYHLWHWDDEILLNKCSNDINKVKIVFITVKLTLLTSRLIYFNMVECSLNCQITGYIVCRRLKNSSTFRILLLRRINLLPVRSTSLLKALNVMQWNGRIINRKDRRCDSAHPKLHIYIPYQQVSNYTGCPNWTKEEIEVCYNFCLVNILVTPLYLVHCSLKIICYCNLIPRYSKHSKLPHYHRIVSDIEGFEKAYQWEIHTLIGSLAVFSLFAIVANGLVLMVLLKNR